MNREKLTNAQNEVYNAIKKYMSKNGFSPSVRDICKITGKTSTDTVYESLKILRRKGYINFVDGIARSITIISDLENKGGDENEKR